MLEDHSDGGLSAASSPRMILTPGTAGCRPVSPSEWASAVQASFGRKAGDSTRPLLRTFVNEKLRVHPDLITRAAKNSNNSSAGNNKEFGQSKSVREDAGILTRLSGNRMFISNTHGAITHFWLSNSI